MREIKLRLLPTDLARLDQEAAAARLSRAELIRQRALTAGNVAGLSTMDYHRLVTDAAAFMHGDLSRQRIELLVAYVINRLDQHSRQASTSSQSAA
jgi:hypothetical protein